MDRRDALKRLAAGGATVAVASVVVTDPAFAYDNPVVTGSPTVTVATTGALTAQIAITPPAGVCPASIVSPSTPTLVSALSGWTTFYPAGNQQMSAGPLFAVSIPSSFGQWFTNDRIRITMVYRYRCIYAGRTTEICVRWFREFRSNAFGAAAGWVLQPGASTGPTIVSCATGVAARSAGVTYSPGARLPE